MELLEIGRTGKPHGLRGEVSVALTSDRPERAEVGAVWTIADRTLTIETIRPHGERWLVRFDGVRSREDAAELAGRPVLAEPIEDPDALWVHELIGAEVLTTDGRVRGRVASIVANPADDLLELDDGTLVPVGFVTDASELPERVRVDAPVGLFDLADS